MGKLDFEQRFIIWELEHPKEAAEINRIAKKAAKELIKLRKSRSLVDKKQKETK